MDIKDLIIFLGIFIIILWLQNNDDKKFKKFKRISLYETIKIPLFAAISVVLIKNFEITSLFIVPDNKVYTDLFNDIYIEPADF